MERIIFMVLGCLCIVLVCGCEDKTTVAPVSDTTAQKPASTDEKLAHPEDCPCCGSSFRAAGREEEQKEAKLAPRSDVAEIMDKASGEGKKVVVLFRKDGPGAQEMEKSFEEMKRKLGGKVLFLAVDASDPKEAAAVQKYQVDSIKEPVILLLSPEGIVLVGFRRPANLALVEKVAASRTLGSYRHALTSTDLVFVVLGKPGSGEYKDVIKQTRAYAKWVGEKETTIQVDISDPSEKIMLKIFNVSAQAKETVTYIFWGGSPVGTLTGKITSEQIQKLMDSPQAGSG